MKRLINPNNKTLGLSEEDKNNPVKVIQALVNRFSGSVSVQAEKTKMGQIFQMRGSRLVPASVGYWSEPGIVNMGTLRTKHVETVLLRVW